MAPRRKTADKPQNRNDSDTENTTDNGEEVSSSPELGRRKKRRMSKPQRSLSAKKLRQKASRAKKQRSEADYAEAE